MIALRWLMARKAQPAALLFNNLHRRRMKMSKEVIMVCAADMKIEQTGFPKHGIPVELRPALKELHEGTGVPYSVCAQYMIAYMAASWQHFLNVSRTGKSSFMANIFMATISESKQCAYALKSILPIPEQKQIESQIERRSGYKIYTQEQAISCFQKHPNKFKHTIWHKQSKKCTAPKHTNYKRLELFKQRILDISGENQCLKTVRANEQSYSIWHDFYNEISPIVKSSDSHKIRSNISLLAGRATTIAALFSVFRGNTTLEIDDYDMNCACKIAQWHACETVKIFAPQQ